MAWKNSRDFKKWQIRKGRRFALRGSDFENITVPKILEKMVLDGKITKFVHFYKNSKEDHDGKDFMVVMECDGKLTEVCFGVTISFKSWNRSKPLHFGVPQLCFPVGTKPETIEKRILGLFTKKPL